MRLTDKHLKQAGARGVRSGAQTDRQLRRWSADNELTPRQTELVLIGARAQRRLLSKNRLAILRAQEACRQRVAAWGRGEVR